MTHNSCHHFHKHHLCTQYLSQELENLDWVTYADFTNLEYLQTFYGLYDRTKLEGIPSFISSEQPLIIHNPVKLLGGDLEKKNEQLQN